MKRRTREEQQTMVREWAESGIDRNAFCAARGISVQTLMRWARGGTGKETEPAFFLPVRLEEEATGRQDGPCRICVGKSIVIECFSWTQGTTVEKALRAVVAACGLM
jgi:hypothetical protein